MIYIEQLHELGWLDADAFEQDDGPLATAIARYHQYLDVSPSLSLIHKVTHVQINKLVASQRSMTSVFVPTLDINLVMQVHQLASWEYRAVCCQTLGIIPDNNVRL